MLYSLGGFSGGLATFMESGKLCYEYNLFEMERTRICASEKIPAGRSKIVVETLTKPKPAANGGKSFYQSAEITVRVNGKAVAQGTVPLLATLLFTANDCLDFGSDLGSPVSLDYLDKAPFPFTGKIIGANVKYPQAAAVPVIVADPD